MVLAVPTFFPLRIYLFIALFFIYKKIILLHCRSFSGVLSLSVHWSHLKDNFEPLFAWSIWSYCGSNSALSFRICSAVVLRIAGGGRQRLSVVA